MLNIIPEEERKKLTEAYKSRVVITCLASVAIIFLVGGLFLLPAYIIAAYKMEEILQPKVGTTSVENTEILQSLALTNSKVAIVLNYATNISITNRLKNILAMEEARVSIENISYKNMGKEDQGKIQVLISGQAVDREALLSFEKRLKTLNFLESVSLPVSNFAKDREIDFNLTAILKL
jgi:MarR-like DNA-binding transcriptional regulator SgrR of sgrS sRNA